MNRLRSPATAKFVGLLFLLHLTVILPGRIGLSSWKAKLGASLWQDLIVGICIDTRFSFPYFALIFGLSYFLWRQIHRIFPSHKSLHKLANSLFLGSACLLTALYTLSNVAASEYKVQRGVYPVIHDILLTNGDADFIVANLSTFWMDRYFLSLLICLVLQAFIMRNIARFIVTTKFRNHWQEGLGFAFATTIISALLFNFYVASPKVFASIINREEINSPLKEMTDSLLRTDLMTVRKQINSLYIKAETDPEKVKLGAQILGFSKENGEQLIQHEIDCKFHPLKRPLPKDETPLLEDFSELSEILFRDRSVPLHLWHVMLESFRANEVHAINRFAPETITPSMNRLYEIDNASADAASIRAINMQQGGVRTSQGISGTFCGIGALPLLASFSRDFGAVPARCVPDVLADAGYQNRMFYGSFLNFDNMKIFFQYHGFKTYEDSQMPPRMPKGVWGLADLSVANFAWSTLEKESPVGSLYNVFLTLSNHTPYRAPEDMPAEIGKRLEDWRSKNKFSGNTDDWNHLIDVAYTDSVVDLFIRRIEESPSAAANSILIAHADHAVSDTALWNDILVHKQEDWLRKIPFVIYFPPALRAQIKDKDRFVAVLNRINKKLTEQTSINDIPHLLLALLSADPQIKDLPSEWRWHTMGGQTTSKDFKIATLPQTRVWGVDASSNAFFIDADGRQIGREQMEILQPEQDLQWQKRHLMPVTSFLGSFLKGYGSKCYGAENIRQGALKE